MSEPNWPLYEQHAGALRRFLRRRVQADDVEDVLADVFAVAWRRLPAELAHEPLPWLYAVAARVVQNHRRSTTRRHRLVARLIAHHGREHAPPPAETIVDDPLLACAFSRLNDRDREAIRLVAWEGLSNEDAARVAGCSTSTFAVRFSRARTRLAAALDAEAATQHERWPQRSPIPCKQSDAA